MKNNKTRHMCDLTFCRHINTENICTIGNQENCVYYRTLQALNGYKENAKWCDDCKKIKELEAERKKNAELEAQIEKMKVCENCKHNCAIPYNCDDCVDYSNWEIKENDR